jgi:ATP-dependent DNA ligase
VADYIVHKAVELTALSAKVRKSLESPRAWVLSPKYDGCHCIHLFADGAHVVTLSRTGEVVKSLDHVAADLLKVYGGLLVHGYHAICGEAWAPGLEFNEISGLFRRQYPSPTLKFVPFDIVPWYPNLDFSGAPAHLGEDFAGACGVPYLARLTTLSTGSGLGTSIIKPRYSYMVGLTLTDAMATAKVDAQHYKKVGGYDGAVLAQANGRYVVGAGKGGEFIKCKPLISESVRVNDTFPAIGSKTGKHTLALGFSHDGLQQKVSTGLTQEQVDLWVADPWRIIGEIIEVEAMGKTVNGFFREPRFKGIRTDA